MAEAAQKLPSDPKKLRAIIAQMTAEKVEREQRFEAELQAREAELRTRNETIEKLDRKIELLLERLELLRHQRFGPKADRISKDQLALFDEAELNVLLEELDAQIAEAKAPHSPRTEPRQTPKRKPLPAHLPRVERILDLPEVEQAAIAATHVRIGFDESEQLGVLPKQYYVIKIKRAKYAPIHAEVPGAENGIRIAPRPAQILPKALAHSSLLAEVVTAKFVDGLPLYRQEKIFAREGIELSRQTLSGWIVQLAAPLAPVLAALKQHLTQGPVLQIDETPVQVLDEPGRANTTKSYMWVYRGGPPGAPVIWFQYAPSRSGEVPIEFLFPEGGPSPEHRFYLQTDGYAGYHALAEKDGIRGHMGCWAHVRRKGGRGGQQSDQDRGCTCVRGPDRQAVRHRAPDPRYLSGAPPCRAAGEVAADPGRDQAVARRQGQQGTAEGPARRGDPVHTEAVADPDHVPAGRSSRDRQQPGRKRDPAVRRRPEGLAVLRQPARCRG
jgi:transposase